MPITIGSNISSLRAQRQLERSSSTLTSVYEKLSSGQRINKASDDAAGLSVSSELKVNARVYSQAARNVNDTLSLLNIADGALEALTSIVTRQAELAEQAANGVYSPRQRQALEREANSLVKEYNRIIESTSFNGINVFSADTAAMNAQHGYGTAQTTQVSIGSRLGTAAGDGSLGEVAFLTMNPATLVSIGDTNNDGIADILANNAGGLSTRLGNGDGTFQAATFVASLSSSITPTILADITGDGVVDALLAEQNGTSFVVHRGNGDGTFAAAQTYSTNGVESNSLEVNDLNGDGLMDVVVGGITSPSGVVFLGRSDGTLSAGASTSQGGLLGDINGDGILDITQSYGGYIATTLGRGDGTFSGMITTATSALGVQLGAALADFNGDGILDLAATQQFGSAFGVYLGNGDGTFRANSLSTPVATGGHQGVEAADLNGDGKLDLMTYNNSTGAFNSFINDGSGSFTLSSSRSKASGSNYMNFELEDLNRDGVVDLAFGLNVGGGGQGLGITLGNVDASGRRNPYQYDVDYTTQSDARQELDRSRTYLNRIADERLHIGSLQSRLSTVLSNIRSAVTETTAALTRITDADIAEETSQLTRTQILQQAGAAVLGQANLEPQIALRLLQSN